MVLWVYYKKEEEKTMYVSREFIGSEHIIFLDVGYLMFWRVQKQLFIRNLHN